MVTQTQTETRMHSSGMPTARLRIVPGGGGVHGGGVVWGEGVVVQGGGIVQGEVLSRGEVLYRGGGGVL